MSDDVHVGRDGWLFLSGGSNEVIRFYTEEGYFAEASAKWVDLLRARRDRAARLGAAYRHMIVPDKLTVYPEHYRDPLAYPDQAPSRQLPAAVAQAPDGDALAGVLVDLAGPFDAVKPFEHIFFKTDSHWTFPGCFAAYQALCQSIGARFNPEILTSQVIASDLALDLGAKLSPPILESYSSRLFIKNARRIHRNILVEYKEDNGLIDAGGLHAGSHVVFQNDSPTDPRRLVLFGDSYSEYRTHQLTGLLAETFAEVHYIWSGSLDWNYIEQVKPDVLVTELAERFHNVVPADDLSIDAFAARRLEEFLAPKSDSA